MTIESAIVFTHETAANQCPNRSLDLWSTDAVTPATSWVNPPAERQFIGNMSYTINYGELQTLDAGPDGIGTLQWTPDADGFTVLSVYAFYADGSYSQYDYYFNVGPW